MNILVLIYEDGVRYFEYQVLHDLLKLHGCDVKVFKKGNINLGTNKLLDSYLKIDKRINVKSIDYFDTKKIEDLNIKAISSMPSEVDLVISFLDDIDLDSLIEIAKIGVLQLRYSHDRISPNLAGIFESYNKEDTTIALLLLNGYEIDRYISATNSLSPVKNRSDVLMYSSLLIIRAVKHLIHNKDYFTIKRENLQFSKKDTKKELSLLNSISMLGNFGFLNISRRVDKLFLKQQWSIYYALNKSNEDFNTNMQEFRQIPTPKKYFWADPFVVDKGDKSYIFFEEYVYRTHKGHISVIEYDSKSGKFSDSKEVLKTSYHLSYPFIMEYENDFYMIPEGSADKDIKLYKAVEFPYKWEHIKTLMSDVIAVDTTLFYHDNKWWMFTNMAQKEGISLNDELYIFYCDDFLKDEWIPHENNPVVSSLITSRPAGKVLSYKNRPYRPSQNSKGWYGRATNFNKIVKLTHNEYEEELVSEITPDFIDGIYAVHTYNSSKNMTVVDGLKKIRRFF